MKKITLLLLTTCLFWTCSPLPTIDEVAEEYVKLCLEVGMYDDDFVDAYFGPEEWKPDFEKEAEIPAARFISHVDDLLGVCSDINDRQLTEEDAMRLLGLRKQLIAVKTKVEMMNGKKYSFDEEAKLLYDAEPPKYDAAHFDNLLSKLDSELPGEGTIKERFLDYQKDFAIPTDKLDTVFTVAIDEARKRTTARYDLPENESFVVEYVTDKSWSGYNYYKGNAVSLIQLNTDFPMYIDRAIDLACHEGYPGHHVFMTLMDQNLYQGKGWVEYSVYPLFCPNSLIAEGTANYGIDVAFPGEERVKYEKEVLFPLAGIDPEKADQYYRIEALRSALNYAGNEAARQYLNGDFTREQAAAWIEKYLLYAPDRALQRTRFIDQYRSYVINYNLGKDMVARHMTVLGGTPDQPDKRWEFFKGLLSNPPTPSSLKE
ncbi:MAG: hypothetical protein AAF502_09485 [Bacteroidota bacterium]